MDSRRQSNAAVGNGLSLQQPAQPGNPPMGPNGRKQSVMLMDVSALSPAARKQSMMIANGQITIKLSKTSTARPYLRSNERDGLLNRLADIIEDGNANRKTSPTKGKLPIEAAYTVMKTITEAAKAPIMPAGMSTFNKLESLRTDPAVKILTSTTWKEFFTRPKPGETPSGLNAHSLYSSNAGVANASSGGGGVLAGMDIAGEDPMLDVLFENLIFRVQKLWKEMKIPVKEQQFYRKSLCKRPIQNIDQCKELSGYIEKLEEHKFMTKQVLQQIQQREIAIKKCYDVLVALHRKFATGGNKGNNGNSFHNSHGGNVFWKEELILSLDEVRCATLEVIKRVQLWRRAMWRPHIFMYKGVNYLLKMKEDMKLIDTDTFKKIIESVPLKMEDLQCVVFNVNYNHFPAHDKYSVNRNRSFRHQYQQDSPEGYIETLVHEFTTNIEREELQAASSVVLEEEMLQQALVTEREALKSKGVFIPLLRPSAIPSSSQANTATTTTNTNTSTHTGPGEGNRNDYGHPGSTPHHPFHQTFPPSPSSYNPATPYQQTPYTPGPNQTQVSNYSQFNNTASSSSSNHVHQTTPYHVSKPFTSQGSLRNLHHETIEEQEEMEETDVHNHRQQQSHATNTSSSSAHNHTMLDEEEEDDGKRLPDIPAQISREHSPNDKQLSPAKLSEPADHPEIHDDPVARTPVDEIHK